MSLKREAAMNGQLPNVQKSPTWGQLSPSIPETDMDAWDQKKKQQQSGADADSLAKVSSYLKDILGLPSSINPSSQRVGYANSNGGTTPPSGLRPYETAPVPMNAASPDTRMMYGRGDGTGGLASDLKRIGSPMVPMNAASPDTNYGTIDNGKLTPPTGWGTPTEISDRDLNMQQKQKAIELFMKRLGGYANSNGGTTPPSGLSPVSTPPVPVNAAQSWGVLPDYYRQDNQSKNPPNSVELTAAIDNLQGFKQEADPVADARAQKLRDRQRAIQLFSSRLGGSYGKR